MSSAALEAAIASHPFVSGLSYAQVQVLTECAMLTRFEKGQVIFHEGDIANRFYLVRDGAVSLETRGDQEESISVQVVGPGDVIGWSWLFPPYYWHFSACAVEPTQAIFFYGTRLRECCEEDRELGYQLMKRVTVILMQRLQITIRESIRLAQLRGRPAS
jgi:CRP-like cAMP-binding protein